MEQENLEEIKEATCIKEVKYKRKIERHYNMKVKNKDLNKGDLVLWNAQLTGIKQDKGKLTPNWKDPYVMKKVIKDGTYVLMKEDGKILPRTWHTNSLRKFYA